MPNLPRIPRHLSDIVQAILTEQAARTTTATPADEPPTKDQSQLVFVGNWQDPCPRRLLFDRDLEPVDIVTWQVIRVHADASKMVAFPSYADLMSAIQVSRATLARALAVLRLTRWLPLCAALRDPQGRFAGHVYALNDEPLPLSEMLTVDDGYVGFAEQAKSHRSAHVRGLAQQIFKAIRQGAIDPAGTTLEPVRLADQLANRLQGMVRLLGDRVQNLNSVHRVQNLNAVRSSSIYIKTTTTPTSHPATQSDAPSPRGADEPVNPSPLVFPSVLSLTDSQCRVLELRLAAVPQTLRQDILDEAAGRVVVKRKTADPVRCEFDYAARLCSRAREGQFVLTDAGERIRRDRQERAQTEDRLRQAREFSEAQRLEALKKHQARLQEKAKPGE